MCGTNQRRGLQRLQQILFVISLLILCWLLMQAVHELGHVVGALATGGTVQRVVLDPLSISRTSVSPNPRPGIVVWAGPLIGCALPLLVWAFIPRRYIPLRKSTQFFAGFCLVANGAYIAGGSFDGIGDCGEMLRTGTPLWVMLAFGATAIVAGIVTWHCLGSVKGFFDNPSIVSRRMVYVSSGFVLVVLACELIFL